MRNLKLMMLTTLLFAVACGPYRAPKNPNPLEETEKVVLLDYGLVRSLNVVKHKAERLDAGQLEVRLAMENEENEDVWADVQFVFRDDDGFELEKTNWEPVQFHRRKVTTLTRNSLSDKAADYRILVRNIK